MPLWNNVDTEFDNAKPKYMNNNDGQSPQNRARDVFATDSGWVRRQEYTDVHGATRVKDEIMVAIGELSSDVLQLANGTVSSVRWLTSTVVQDTAAQIGVVYNERVSVNSALTIAVTSANTSANVAPATVTASYVSGNNTNELVFEFTAWSNAATYSIDGQSIANTAAANAVVDVISGWNSERVITNTYATSANTKSA